jgi:hypothetical protein
MSLQTQDKRKTTKRSGNAASLLDAALLFTANSRWTCRAALTIPASTGSSGASRAVTVLFNVSLLVRVLLVLSNTEDGKNRVEERTCAAEEAEQGEKEYTEQDSNDDTGNGAARKTSAAASSDRHWATLGAGGDGRLEGDGRGWAAGVGDYNES